MRYSSGRKLTYLLALVLVVAPIAVPRSLASKHEASSAARTSNRGPGMKGPALDSVKVPVPRTSDLTHVEARHYAAALGKDPARIFDFVRDYIAYEAYPGCLRGPHGTLLAMAGNSVDRAVLLASMLQHAGHRVRYARGTLPEREARELVTSMWARPLRPAPPSAAIQTDPSLVAAGETLVRAFKRDYTLITDQLRGRRQRPDADLDPTLESLTREAGTHYWVQWAKDGKWIDLDPSYSDAIPGRTYARVVETVEALPDTLFHLVRIRLRLEEYLGKNATTREILTFTGRAADLSGTDVFLIHQPENWKGPAGSPGEAISSAAANTGRVKPVLIAGDRFVIGEVFRPRVKSTGIGGLGDLLGGAGSRNPVPIATAEWLEFEFEAPGGHRETVAREIFDVLGKARRAAGQEISTDEVRRRTEAQGAFDVTRAVHALFLTSGRIDPEHLSNLVAAPPSSQQESTDDILRDLLRVAALFTATSDAILMHLRDPGRGSIVLYPDSPRVHIVELSESAGNFRVSLDVRRDRLLAARMPTIQAQSVNPGTVPYPQDVFSARIFYGVLAGSLERVLMEYLTATVRDARVPWRPVVSTSSILDRAQTENVNVIMLSQGSNVRAEVPEDARVRVNELVAKGYLVFAPARAIAVGDQPRFAWWRIDPRSGETIGMTDDGLHSASTGYTVQVRRVIDSAGNVKWYVAVFYHGVKILGSFFTRESALREYLWRLFQERFFP